MTAMPTTPLILLPPSEGKRPGGDAPAWSAGSCSFAALDPTRRRVMSALVAAMRSPEADRAKLLGVKGAALATATATDRGVRRAPGMAAIDRYDGVLYDALEAATLPARARKRLAADVIIFSGLFGAVRATDPIPDYKLKMGASLPTLGTITSLWRGSITKALTPELSGRVVWNLLPKEHDAAWSCPVEATATTLRVTFLDEQPRARGEARTFNRVNHWNKLLKGALVRHILTTGASGPDDLVDFEHPEGYRLDASLTETVDGVISISMVRGPR